MDSAQLWAALIGTTGLGAVLLAAVNGLIKWLSGAAGREKGRNADLVRQRDDAYARMHTANTLADTEARRRRIAQEYASALRGDLLELGVEQSDLRPWPTEKS